MRRHLSSGLPAALIIIVLWGATLAVALSIPFRGNLYLLALPLMPVVAFLYAGLFITAHDAMHAVVVPHNRQLNNLTGSFCSIAYALFSFERLKTEHWEHHRGPASAHDPDYHDGAHKGFFRW
jgi:beta-carotene ketolase (CrtW type)